MPSMPGAPSTTVTVFAAMCSGGLAVAAVGTFLPWFRSGHVHRNSYETVALANHFGITEGSALAVLTHSWVLIPLVSGLCVGLFAIRRLRTAATLAFLLAIVLGTVSVAAAVGPGGEGPIGVAVLGPIVTAVGTAVAAFAASGVLALSRRRRTGARGGEQVCDP